ncbi:uncharacterized protein YeeX (DUF496 family) [Acetoanaerobium pronyense]|uniref:Uncharacterized protein YeeX (DUF496 family) n=1 Tax=Acetoanaerobium pronyense TaxID=1482736 RepID=A0ABS4KLU6_9FIRM|nr:hypothetical protein [Acetoanaerobium pronyense]MBP2028758.1 uncharacterized protein YeeX (DUF496 family) [Acetoanaerobium pronyense]
MEKLIDFVKTEFPKDALEIQYGIELLNQCIGGSVESIKSAFSTAIDNRDFEKLNNLQENLKTIDDLQNTLDKYIDLLQLEDSVEEDIIKMEDLDKDLKELPDYESLRVDENIPYTLYDDFTYKRPSGFEIFGIRYYCKDWKDVLVSTCEILAENDMLKFQSFLNDKTMQGRKVNYFCKNKEDIRAPRKINGTNIYVMTNMSANQTRNVIERMLRKYNIRINDYKLFLKADYSSRHE